MPGPATYQGHPSEKVIGHMQLPRSYASPGECPHDMSGRKLHYPFSGASLCVHFIKAIICHGKQLLPHREKLSDDMAFGNSDTLLLVSFSSLSLHPLLSYCCGVMGSSGRQEALFANEGKQEEEQACPYCQSALRSLWKP